MSLYTFATSNFTTLDDVHRKPAINTWQIVRTLAFLVTAFVAIIYVGRSTRVVEASALPRIASTASVSSVSFGL